MRLLSGAVAVVLSGLLVVPLPVQALAIRDPWVHPRNEPYEPSRHYRDDEGSLYYFAEHGIKAIRVTTNGQTEIRVSLGSDLLSRARDTGGSLASILLWDSNSDDIVDRSTRGRIVGEEAFFDDPDLHGVDLQSARWQIGVRYVAGPGGASELDGRYLASVDARDPSVAMERVVMEPEPEPVVEAPPEPEPELTLPHVGAGPFPPGLVIFKHREGVSFDLNGFVERPARYIENFDRLTRAADGDDWTVTNGRGELRTHLDREDLLLVRTQGDFSLEVRWGDVPLDRFLEQYLDVPADADGCYVSSNGRLRNRDQSVAVSPHRILYCPQYHLALFDAPDGYEVGLSAMANGDAHEYTEAGTSIGDNLRLYVKEVYPRRPSARATGSVGGNIGAGFADARGDAGDLFRHAFTGTEERHIHTGRSDYRASPVTAPFISLAQLVRLEPRAAFGTLITGVESGVQAGADAVSAVHNAVLNPLIQGTVGLAASPGSADAAGDWLGALSQALVKNAPGGERSNGVIDLRDSWFHDRAFDPPRYTRTDTQLNIDRLMTAIVFTSIGAIINHNDGGGGGPVPSELPGDIVVETPGPIPN